MSGEHPGVIPMISYADGLAALDWLTKAFGFQERRGARQTWPDGTLSHAEMDAGHGLIMLATPTPDYVSPRRHRETCEQARRWSSVPYVVDGGLVYEDDLDSHYMRAKAAGATTGSDQLDELLPVFRWIRGACSRNRELPCHEHEGVHATGSTPPQAIQLSRRSRCASLPFPCVLGFCYWRQPSAGYRRGGFRAPATHPPRGKWGA